VISRARSATSFRGDAAVTPLSSAEVGALLRALGFPVTDDDVDEITHRWNAFASALEPLGRLELEGAAPPGASLDLDPS
jgi:hypothetical protein